MADSKMKTWQKVGLGILTVGVTATAIYFGVKAIKKQIEKKKKADDAKAAVPKIDVKKDIPPRKVQLISNIQHQLKNSKMDAFQGVTDDKFVKLSEAELDRMLALIKKIDAKGETAFKASDPKGFAELMKLVEKVLGTSIKS